MASSKELFNKVLRIAKRYLWDCFIKAVFYCWGFTLLLNNAVFSQTTDVLQPIRFFMAAIAAVFLGALFGCMQVKKLLSPPEEILRFVSYVSAALSCLLASVSVYAHLVSPYAMFAAAVFSGAAVCFYSYTNFYTYLQMKNLEVVTVEFCTVVLAVAIFIPLVAMLHSNALLITMTIMIAFSAVSVLRDYYRDKLKSPRMRFHSPGDDGDGSKERTENFSDRKPLTRLRDELIKQKGERLQGSILSSLVSLFILLTASGLILGFEFNVTQKTLHFPGILVNTDHLGETSFVAILYLLLWLVSMGIILGEYIRPNIPVAGIACAVLLASLFFGLPYLTMMNFILVTVAITALFFIIMYLLFEALRTIESFFHALRLFSISLVLLALGGLIGATFAYVVLLNSYSFPFYDELFRFVPAFFILAIIIILLLSFRSIRVLLKQHVFKKELDTSKLEDRCQMLADQYRFTKRETEVLMLLATGKNVPSIAETLLVSTATAKTHVLHVYQKTGVSSRQELLRIIYAEG